VIKKKYIHTEAHRAELIVEKQLPYIFKLRSSGLLKGKITTNRKVKQSLWDYNL